MSGAAPDRAMILAAGFGTRMGALSRDTPKPLLKVAGRALLDRAIDRCAEVGVDRVVVNTHYLSERIKSHLEGVISVKIDISDETEILETGGGVAAALPLLGDAPFYTLNADAVWAMDAPLDTLRRAWRDENMDALLLLCPIESARAYTRPGDFFIDPDGRPRRRDDAPRAPYVYTGAQIISPRAFDDAPGGAYSLNVIWNRLAARGRLFACVQSGAWVDVGTPEGLALASELVG